MMDLMFNLSDWVNYMAKGMQFRNLDQGQIARKMYSYQTVELTYILITTFIMYTKHSNLTLQGN